VAAATYGLPDDYRLQIITKRSNFAAKMYPSNNMCRIIGWWSFWSWFDANRTIFDELMRENDFFYISSPVTLTFDL